jgi:hypothetical protein
MAVVKHSERQYADIVPQTGGRQDAYAGAYLTVLADDSRAYDVRI